MNNRRPTPPARGIAFLPTPGACRWAALGFFSLMVLLGSIPGKAEAASAVVHDKVLHFVAYALLSALVYGAVVAGPLARAFATLVVVALLGAVDEGLQSLLPYRNASVFDWQVDMLAAGVAVAILSMLQAVLPRPATASLTRKNPP